MFICYIELYFNQFLNLMYDHNKFFLMKNMILIYIIFFYLNLFVLFIFSFIIFNHNVFDIFEKILNNQINDMIQILNMILWSISIDIIFFFQKTIDFFLHCVIIINIIINNVEQFLTDIIFFHYFENVNNKFYFLMMISNLYKIQ